MVPPDHSFGPNRNTMRKAIIVYLDTSDFNNLYKKDIGTALKSVKEYLIREVSEGNVIIGYSYPLMFELFRHYDEKHRDDRLEKARFVKQLCQKNAHPHIGDLDQGPRFPNDGIWMPRNVLETFSPDSISERLRLILSEKVANHPNLTRRQRRALKTTTGFAELTGLLSNINIGKSDLKDIPISQSFLDDRYFQKFLSGSITGKFFKEKILEWAMDPESFIQLWYEYAGKSNPLEKLVDDQFSKIIDATAKMKEKYDQAKLLKKNISRGKRAYYNSIRSIDNETKRLLPKFPKIDKELYDFNRIDFAEGYTPRWKPFNSYLMSVASGQHRAQKSDLVDLMHLLYLPDVDLMRCDKRMSGLLGNSPWFDTSKIVSNLNDLPGRIEALTKDRDDSGD